MSLTTARLGSYRTSVKVKGATSKKTTIDKSLKSIEQFKRQQRYYEYLMVTAHTVFSLFFSDGSLMSVPYKHRWSNAYRKGIMKKLYQLGEWVRRHKLSMAMVSLTCEQAGLTDIQILDNQKEAWDKLRQTLSKMGLQYYLLFEPHKSGISHMHVLIIGKITNDMIKRLEGLWHNKYEMGLKDIDFKFTSDKVEIETKLVNYLMKYLSKTICTDIESDDSLMRFHSMFWETSYRLWSSSAYLSFVMRRLKKTDSKVLLDHIKISGALEKDIPINHTVSVYPEYLEKWRDKDAFTDDWMSLLNNDPILTPIYGVCVPLSDEMILLNDTLVQLKQDSILAIEYKRLHNVRVDIQADNERLHDIHVLSKYGYILPIALHARSHDIVILTQYLMRSPSADEINQYLIYGYIGSSAT